MLKERIESEMRQAIRSGDELRLSVLRLLLAAVHNREIEKRTKSGEAKGATLTDEEVLGAVRSELKKRLDAVAAYEAGQRPEAAARERAEADILNAFLPAELSDQELEALVGTGMAATGASSREHFGKLMGWMMGQVKGRALGDRVAEAVRRKLSSQ